MNPLWRISRHDDLSGLGGERTSGRWHTAAKGKRIVYFAEHPAIALLEVLANLKGDPSLFLDTYRLMKIANRESIVHEQVGPLPADWREHLQITRAIGDAWLAEGRSALLRVPSAPAPESWNLLLNPLHAETQTLGIDWTRWMTYDRRLFHLVDR